MDSQTKTENCLGWAATDPTGVLSPYKFSRRPLGSDDVSIKITHCGVCYADVIWSRNMLGDSIYPLVPGHEIAGIVKEVGSNVQGIKVGDHVGVGTYVNSCRNCEYCNDGIEVQCVKGPVFTFNHIDVDGTVTKGGYSSHIVVHERCCFKIPSNYPLASAAPLLCAGITVYTPMMRYNMNQPGKSLGVIGLGGLVRPMDSQTKTENCLGWAATDPTGVLSPYKFSRRPLGSDDVSIKITHCGVCYADVIWSRNMLGDSIYPLVPGHEIAGIVKEVGSNVQGIKVGDHVGVGTYVNSCRNCEYCNDGIEVQCVKGPVFTFNHIDADGTVTKGGYSSHIVVHERYCFKIPSNYPLASAAPLLCAGITVYTPMMRYNMNQPGKSLGVIGLGGLGHMAVKFGKAFGLSVTVLSTSTSKKEEALSLLGADNFIVTSDQEQVKGLSKSLDFIIDTASGDHPFDPYWSLLKSAGVYALVGFPSEIKFSPASLNMGMKTFAGSVTGGTKMIQEMISFCAARKIYPQIEVIPIQYANEALERLVKKDVKYRFVIDIENTLK